MKPPRKNILSWSAGVLAVLAGLYLLSRYSYLLFHTAAEMFSILISFGIFVIMWNSRRFFQNGYLLFLGVSYLFIGMTDLVHTLSYKGMGVFPGYGANMPTQFWIAARYMETGALLAAPLFLKRQLRPEKAFTGFGLLFAATLVLVFGGFFPECFREGSGLTPFKIYSEYAISSLLLLALYALYVNRDALDRKVYRLVSYSIGLTIAAELSFTQYVSVYGPMNMVGHFFKLASFYLIYKAMIETGLNRPFDLLFRELKENRDALERERDFSDAVLDTAGALMMVLDEKGRLVRFNRACEQITGYTGAEVAGKAVWELFSPGNPARCKAALEKTRDPASSAGNVCELSTRDGSVRQIAWANTVLGNGAGRYMIASGLDLTERVEMEKAKEALIGKLSEALDNIKTLKGLLPMCAWCKKIRDDGGYWQQVEKYIETHSEAEFTHGICPECLRKIEPEFFD